MDERTIEHFKTFVAADQFPLEQDDIPDCGDRFLFVLAAQMLVASCHRTPKEGHTGLIEEGAQRVFHSCFTRYLRKSGTAGYGKAWMVQFEQAFVQNCVANRDDLIPFVDAVLSEERCQIFMPETYSKQGKQPVTTYETHPMFSFQTF